MPQNNHLIDIQHACKFANLPNDTDINTWATLALNQQNEPMEVSIRFVEEAEIQALNAEFRQKDKTTNVLSFESSLPDFIELEVRLLGDVILCPSVIEKEALEQHKSINDHFAHLIMHGILHLLGYDHIEPKEATIMETLEIQLLDKLGIKNPYEVITHG